MKFLTLIFLFISTVSFADQVFYNTAGFATCYEKNDKVYFLYWDEMTNAQSKSVSYFEKTNYENAAKHAMSGCSEQKYIHNVPSEILKAVTGNDFPIEILESVNQIENGGNIFRTEKSVDVFISVNHKLFQKNSPNQIPNLRKNYGDQFTLAVVASWTKKMIRTDDSCEKYIGTCDFYLCQEQKSPCGLDGYNLSFGFKYCSDSRFKLLDQMKTKSDKNWVNDVFQCLQKNSFLKSMSLALRTCDKIQSDAYDSHPNCYLDAGFCALETSEKINIFNLIKNEIFSADALKQGLEILNQCESGQNEKQILINELSAEAFR